MGSYGLHDSDLKIRKTGNNKFDNGKAFKIADSLASRRDATFPSFFIFEMRISLVQRRPSGYQSTLQDLLLQPN